MQTDFSPQPLIIFQICPPTEKNEYEHLFARTASLAAPVKTDNPLKMSRFERDILGPYTELKKISHIQFPEKLQYYLAVYINLCQKYLTV